MMDDIQASPCYPLIDEEGSKNIYGPNQTGQRRKRNVTTTKLLYFTILALLVVVFWLSSRPLPAGTCGLSSDKLFGNIPWHAVILENDVSFIQAEPLDTGNETTLWNDIFAGTWVAFENPSIGGATGRGMKMSDVAAEPSSWSDTSEGFGVAVMHQLHCVMSIKSAVLKFERGDTISSSEHNHLHHCIEVLRQAVMCHSDLTLEHPEPNTHGKQELSGWGNVHFCRDFSRVIEVIRKKAITRSLQGWISL